MGNIHPDRLQSDMGGSCPTVPQFAHLLKGAIAKLERENAGESFAECLAYITRSLKVSC